MRAGRSWIAVTVITALSPVTALAAGDLDPPGGPVPTSPSLAEPAAAISADEAQTWRSPKAIASRNPDEPMRAQTTYPYLCQAADGSVLVQYHRVYAQEGRDWYDPMRELVRLDPDWLAEA